MDKCCFLIGRKDSLFKELVARLLVDLNASFELVENGAIDLDGLLVEIKDVDPNMILLEEDAPFSDDSLLMGLLINLPDLPVIVINEESSVMHVVHRETRALQSSNELIETINYM